MTTLILGGTAEARALIAALPPQTGPVVFSLAGATRHPRLPEGPTGTSIRIGGFGGAAGLRHYLRSHGTARILDMTHPFAVRMSTTAAQVAVEEGLPYLRYMRPPWVPTPQDQWSFVAQDADLAGHIRASDIVFLATGRQTVAALTGLPAAYVYCRQIDMPATPFPWPNGAYIQGRPPFSGTDEVALFQRLDISVLVVKNSGGRAGFSKLLAARRLGLRVVLIGRPRYALGDETSDIRKVHQWIQSR